MRFDNQDLLALLGLIALGAGLWLATSPGVALAVVGVVLLRAGTAPGPARAPAAFPWRPRWRWRPVSRPLLALGAVLLLLGLPALSFAAGWLLRPGLGV